MELHLIYEFNDALEFRWKEYVFESMIDAVKILESRKFSKNCNIHTRHFSEDEYKDIKDSGLLGMQFLEMDGTMDGLGHTLCFEVVPPVKDESCEMEILEFVPDIK